MIEKASKIAYHNIARGIVTNKTDCLLCKINIVSMQIIPVCYSNLRNTILRYPLVI